MVLAFLLAGATAGGAGCMVVKPVVGAGAAVAGTAVKTTARATGAAADAVIPDAKPPAKDEAPQR